MSLNQIMNDASYFKSPSNIEYIAGCKNKVSADALEFKFSTWRNHQHVIKKLKNMLSSQALLNNMTFIVNIKYITI